MSIEVVCEVAHLNTSVGKRDSLAPPDGVLARDATKSYQVLITALHSYLVGSSRLSQHTL